MLLQHVIIEYEKIPERLDEFMVLHRLEQSEILEFLINNYKKTIEAMKNQTKKRSKDYRIKRQ